MLLFLKFLWNDDRGVTAIEYGLSSSSRIVSPVVV